MPSIFHTTTQALSQRERFPADALLLDVRFRRQWPSAAGAGSLRCSLELPVCAGAGRRPVPRGASKDPRLWQPYTPLIDWRSGQQAVQQAASTDDLVVLCTCPERYHRSHRRQVATSLARALGFTLGGDLL